ncbi:MAG: hypothetical protein FXF49_02635 [Flexistipes sinusarabici]|uniref:Uncharacterized protein n=1 Tax=Flexistipes sinusarabici TaxID=2352 RepID=A0A5D0MKN1_FLESI|nr:hypothetical protein [Flexistipes sinusarabici]TYB34237.1 MAG: hypothetical protein FXF49_02635 [Flexistipes sinusarabici]
MLNYIVLKDPDEKKFYEDYFKKHKIKGTAVPCDNVKIIKPFLDGNSRLFSKNVQYLVGNTSLRDILTEIAEIVSNGTDIYFCEEGIQIDHINFPEIAKYFDLVKTLNNELLKIRSRQAEKKGRPFGTKRSPLDKQVEYIRKKYLQEDKRVAEIAKELNIKYPILYNYMKTRGIIKEKKGKKD